MRISTDCNDPGFATWAEIGARRVIVRLDGKPVPRAYTADSDAGFIDAVWFEAAGLTDAGYPSWRGVRERRYGIVTINIVHPAPPATAWMRHNAA